VTTQPGIWDGWIERTGNRECPACHQSFVPNHPRRKFCGRPGCPGRVAPAAPRRRRRDPSERQREADRARQVSGFLADMVIAASGIGHLATPRAMADSLMDLVRADRAGDREAARTAAVRLAGMAMGAVTRRPPPDPPGA
jgi:hypothetical protein